MCIASLHFPFSSRTAYHISCELRIELYLVLAGLFSQIKNRIFPSADTVGLSSARSVLIFGPIFSILMTVSALMIFSFWAIKVPEVSWRGCAKTVFIQVKRINRVMAFFKTVDFGKATLN